MEQIKAKALFKIKEGKLEEFKALIPLVISTVKEKDSGTLTYEWYLKEEQMECTVLEEYSNSQAVMAHAANVGEHLGKFLEIADLSLEIYGSPDKELRTAMEGMAPKVFAFYKGL